MYFFANLTEPNFICNKWWIIGYRKLLRKTYLLFDYYKAERRWGFLFFKKGVVFLTKCWKTWNYTRHLIIRSKLKCNGWNYTWCLIIVLLIMLIVIIRNVWKIDNYLNEPCLISHCQASSLWEFGTPCNDASMNLSSGEDCIQYVPSWQWKNVKILYKSL